ncbi:DNA repair protein RecO [Reinekea thalattae]|uniref:DNA repair protein RecO n=1 Tax=Reinekea thalattae TaxID=2593301 RepID=A0A5C8ZCL2_9GAMM|nr:DNA repair protein RecO C-terminal domain-containing protein [Reinekea thalattae]TXR54911.1 hypothetical protein FME95_00430 [Reinekea thalattae]
MKRSIVTRAFLLVARPYKESDYLCDFWTETEGRVRCKLSCEPPEPYREIDIKMNTKHSLANASNFRYTGALLVDTNQARILAFYVNELLYRLLPLGQADRQLFGTYISTLLHLNESLFIQASLRFFEQAVLATLGQALDYQRSADSQLIEAQRNYRFDPQRGFIADSQGRYSGAMILAISQQDYSFAGALSLARECQRQIIDQLLLANNTRLESRAWPMDFLITKK